MKKVILFIATHLFCFLTYGEDTSSIITLGNSTTGARFFIDLYGGAFTGFTLPESSVNPFSWRELPADMPKNNRNGAIFQGHFLCLGRWGAPTAGEIKAGVPHNGQPGNQLWQVISQHEGEFLHIGTHAPLDGVNAERLIYFDAVNAVCKVTGLVQSTLSAGRLYNIVQHATIGAPFLSASTIIDSNAKAGFMQHLSYPDPHQYEYRWPNGILDSQRTEVDLTSCSSPVGYVSTHLFEEPVGWITASSPECGLLIGYVWNSSEYPWLNLWHKMKDGKPYAKGLEFGTAGIGRSYQDLLAVDTRFHGKNSFFYLDAQESVEKSFFCFQVKIPADYRGVQTLSMQDGQIILTEKGSGQQRSISIRNSFASQQLTLTNSTKSERIDESFVIKRADLKNPEQDKLPALKNEKGEWVPSQADDVDMDGQWDELAFVYSLKAGETAKLFVEWRTKEGYPQFTQRTNARYGKWTKETGIQILSTDMHDKYNIGRGKGVAYPFQTDGPAWENDKMGFRHYFDGRNVRDVFGKRTGQMVMDTVGIRPNGRPGDTYHVLNWWGRDIMSGASSIGLGGIALQTKDSLIRMGIMAGETVDNVDSTRYTLVVNGPVRSIFKLDFYGWDIGKEKLDVHETMTIWAGKYGYENVITTSPLPKGSYLVTGIVNNFNDMPYHREKIGLFETMSTHDIQTYDKGWVMGMSLLIDRNNWVSTFEAPKTGKGITTTWCVRLKPDKQNTYRYHCCAAWELTDERFLNRDFYLETIRNYAKELSEKLRVEIN